MLYAFEWDPAKAKSNLAKHGVPFELAIAVFGDPLQRMQPDPQHPDRWITLGAAKEQLLVVVHTDAETATDQDRSAIRIISARRATPRERRSYRDER